MKKFHFNLRRLNHWAPLLILAVAMNTCVHDSPQATGPESSRPKPEELTDPPMELIKEALAPAVQSLLKKAEQALLERDLDGAEAQVERAYRMESRDFRVLILLAKIARAKSAVKDAEQWALRDLVSLPTQYPKQRRHTWLFIAACRRDLNDFAGAAAAESQALSPR